MFDFDINEEKKIVTTDADVEHAFKLIDPNFGTKLQKSRDAFISISQFTGQIGLSAFFARKLGFVSGDRIGYTRHSNTIKYPQVFFVFKTTQHQKTTEIKIRNGTFTFNSKIMCAMLRDAFNFNPDYGKKIRLYVNHNSPQVFKMTFPGIGQTECQLFQLFDIPALREDFATPELKEAYVKKMKDVVYIYPDEKKAV